MPSWLIAILQLFGPAVLKWALNFVDSKWPGAAALIQDLLKYIDNHPQGAEVAVKACQDHMCGLVGNAPDTVKM